MLRNYRSRQSCDQFARVYGQASDYVRLMNCGTSDFLARRKCPRSREAVFADCLVDPACAGAYVSRGHAMLSAGESQAAGLAPLIAK
jgi:hypothetical protein